MKLIFQCALPHTTFSNEVTDRYKCTWCTQAYETNESRSDVTTARSNAACNQIGSPYDPVSKTHTRESLAPRVTSKTRSVTLHCLNIIKPMRFDRN